MRWKQLLASITRSVDEELRLRNAYLAAENRILRNHIKGRVPLTDAERKTLAEMGQKLGKKALDEVATIAQPDTILAWHRTLMAQTCDRSPPRNPVGRPRMDQELEALVVRMARENRSWGYDRMVGAVANLGYRISDQTVGNILKRHDIPPAPERMKTLTWREFICMHMAVLGATEFFSSAVWSWLRLLVSSVLSFLHVGLRKGYAAGMTCLCYRGRIWPLFLWSPDEQRDAERWVWLVRAAAPSQQIPFGTWVLQSISDSAGS
jgi:putative transposase